MVKHRLGTRWPSSIVCGLHRAHGNEEREFRG
jgi:hypothetical protein